jgi:hypothetical protein
MRIAILEDDLSQLELIVQWVNQAGHNALPFHDANAFYALWSHGSLICYYSIGISEKRLALTC